jgi:hypothetical protein
MIKPSLFIPCVAALAAVIAWPNPGHAQQKTARACETEWRANKAAIQSSGKTKKDFIVECRAGTGEAAATAAPTTTPPPAATETAGPARQKTAKACEAEWRANRATIQGAGQKKKDFITECRGGTGQAAATAAPSTPSAATPPPPSATETAKTEEQPAPAPRRGRLTTESLARAGFSTEAEAKAHCPGDTVVWANTRSKIYHFAGTRSYGKTRAGAYMCERDAAPAGIRSAKNEKRP